MQTTVRFRSDSSVGPACSFGLHAGFSNIGFEVFADGTTTGVLVGHAPAAMQGQAQPKKPRFASLDMVRGLIIMIMAWDHGKGEHDALQYEARCDWSRHAPSALFHTHTPFEPRPRTRTQTSSGTTTTTTTSPPTPGSRAGLATSPPTKVASTSSSPASFPTSARPGSSLRWGSAWRCSRPRAAAAGGPGAASCDTSSCAASFSSWWDAWYVCMYEYVCVCCVFIGCMC